MIAVSGHIPRLFMHHNEQRKTLLWVQVSFWPARKWAFSGDDTARFHSTLTLILHLSSAHPFLPCLLYPFARAEWPPRRTTCRAMACRRRRRATRSPIHNRRWTPRPTVVILATPHLLTANRPSRLLRPTTPQSRTGKPLRP